VAARGGDMNPHRMAFTQLICCAATEAEAEAKYYEGVRYFHRMNTLDPKFTMAPGYTTIRSQQAMAARLRDGPNLRPEDRARAAKGEMSFWEYDEKGYIIAGTPQRVRQRVRELAQDLRIGQLIGCLHMGNLPEEIAAENTHLFGTQVIPHLRDLWADQPDHWTPPISQQRIAAREGSAAKIAVEAAE
jgi:alkanesulfonate monooxygenase SsuD/methylene tetrahydromethanopterin reductase-like flavin-dependent oxidoreductase (luciferase family)